MSSDLLLVRGSPLNVLIVSLSRLLLNQSSHDPSDSFGLKLAGLKCLNIYCIKCIQYKSNNAKYYIQSVCGVRAAGVEKDERKKR